MDEAFKTSNAAAVVVASAETVTFKKDAKAVVASIMIRTAATKIGATFWRQLQQPSL